MATAPPTTAPPSGNLNKHTSRNPLQQALLRGFHRQIARLTAGALPPGAAAPLVVEVGCGEGFVLSALSQALPRAHLAGFDLRGGALDIAASQAPAAGLARADALHLPLRDHTADVVLCLEVLEHLRDPWAAVKELQRVSRGAVIVSVPNQPWFALANLARGKNLRTWGDDPEHMQHWRGGTFLRLLRQHARVTRVAHPFPWVIALCQERR